MFLTALVRAMKPGRCGVIGRKRVVIDPHRYLLSLRSRFYHASHCPPLESRQSCSHSSAMLRSPSACSASGPSGDHAGLRRYQRFERLPRDSLPAPSNPHTNHTGQSRVWMNRHHLCGFADFMLHRPYEGIVKVDPAFSLWVWSRARMWRDAPISRQSSPDRQWSLCVVTYQNVPSWTPR
jgi:hypothetical protein